MTKNIKDILLLSDVYGTLLDSKQIIPERNIIAIKRFIQKGGNFSLVTGCSFFRIKSILNLIKINAPAILNGGALIYDTVNHEILYSYCLDDKLIKQIASLSDIFPQIGMGIIYINGMYVFKKSNELIQHIKTKNIPVIKALENKNFNAAFKILLIIPDFLKSQICNYLKNNLVEGSIFFKDKYLEITNINSSKYNAFEKYLKITGFKRENTVILGNDYNDLEIIKNAGFGVCEKNSPESVKKISKLVLSACDEGCVADAIEYIEKYCEIQ